MMSINVGGASARGPLVRRMMFSVILSASLAALIGTSLAVLLAAVATGKFSELSTFASGVAFNCFRGMFLVFAIPLAIFRVSQLHYYFTGRLEVADGRILLPDGINFDLKNSSVNVTKGGDRVVGPSVVFEISIEGSGVKRLVLFDPDDDRIRFVTEALKAAGATIEGH